MSEHPPYTPHSAFFLDIDGTLVELAEHPDAVEPAAELPLVLETLYQACHGAVALVSGRSLAAIDRLIAQPRLPAAGLHGAQRRNAAGEVHSASAASPVPRVARDRAERFCAAHPGVLVEDKGAGFALHYRNAPQCAEAAAREMAAVVHALGASYRLQHGKMVLEVLPAAHNKGDAIAAFLAEEPFRRRVPVFIGDDVTDEDGFRRVQAHGGTTIKVGSGATAARWRLPDTAAVLDWLRGYSDFSQRQAAGQPETPARPLSR